MWKWTVWAIGEKAIAQVGTGKSDFTGQAANQVYSLIEAVTPIESHVTQNVQVVHSDPMWHELMRTYLDGYVYEVRYEKVIGEY